MEFGEARHLHDLRDMNSFIDWFGSHVGNVPQLRSLSSGLAASEGDGVKCDETEKVVSEIQGSFESVSVRNATIKVTSDGAHPECVEAGVNVDKANFCADRPLNPVPALYSSNTTRK